MRVMQDFGNLDFGLQPIGIKMHSVTRHLQVLESFSFVCLHFKWVKKKTQTDLSEDILQAERNN